MNENSWLYWSAIIFGAAVDENGDGFHEWKFMALLKQNFNGSSTIDMDVGFHEWKFMALLKRNPANSTVHVIFYVSMNENSWLYWSDQRMTGDALPSPRFHEWKFMALLKRRLLYQKKKWIWCFHEWKFMALLKQCSCCGVRLGVWSCFHEWKFMALLKLVIERPTTFHILTLFPWMKIHGSIEATA